MQIVTFIFEQGLLLDPRRILGGKFWTFVESTNDYLETLERQTNDGDPISPLEPCRKDCSTRKGLWTHLRRTTGGLKYPSLLECFILHCEALPLIPLRNRTSGGQEFNQDLTAHLQIDFLPKVFSILEMYLSEWNLDIDLDGNILISLLRVLLSDTTLSLSQRLGDSLSQIAVSITPSVDMNMKILRSHFPVQVSLPEPRLLAAFQTNLLPFHHDVLDEDFSLIDLPSDNSREVVEYGALEFDTAFSDKFHWHNAKRPILPKHLGGEQAKPSDEWQRMKMMKKHQRFISQLTMSAATLTGALGTHFNRLTIVTARTEEAQGKYNAHHVCYPSIPSLMS